MAYSHEDVIAHFPPQLIVGNSSGEEKVILEQENEQVKVQLVEMTCDYMYSNPTGMFKLSIADKPIRLSNYTNNTYEEHKQSQQAAKKALELQEKAQAEDGADKDNSASASEAAAEPEEPIQLDVRDWLT